MSLRPDVRRPADAAAPSGATSLLRYLQQEVHRARTEGARAMRSPADDPAAAVAARARLLQALEAYADALTTCRLPIPPVVRDDLRLQRGLVARSSSQRRAGSR